MKYIVEYEVRKGDTDCFMEEDAEDHFDGNPIWQDGEEL